MSEFLENAEHNQNLFLKIQKLVLKIISQTNLNDLANTIESFFHEELKTEICKIYFFAPENSFNLGSEKIITPEIATSVFAELFKANEIALGGLTEENSALIFGAKANVVEGAIGKLKSNKLAGTLALGSSQTGKFPKDSETLFLEFVISVFSNQIDKFCHQLMNKEIKLFLNYLEQVRNYSEHTVKNYSADLKNLKNLNNKKTLKIGPA